MSNPDNIIRIAILQPSFLPWLGCLAQMQQSSYFIYYDDVAFDKHGWRNRNRIKTASGIEWITVPVFHKGKSGQPLKEVKIDHSNQWCRKMLGKLRQNYSKSAYFHLYYPDIEKLLLKKHQFLVDLNLEGMDFLLASLGITVKTFRSSELGITGDRNKRLIDHCKAFQATEYLTGDLAKHYLDEKQFIQNGITIRWQGFSHPIYSQLNGEFIPYLSTIDLLFNCGPNSPDILRTASTGKS